MKRDLLIQRMPIADLTPAPYNPRTISPEALSGLRASVQRFGLVEPVVWNRRTQRVVGGHQRLRVLEQLGEQEAPVVVVDLPEIEERALNIALNSPAIAGEFTPEIHTLLAEIEAAMPDLAGELRFDDLAGQLRHLLAELAPEDGLVDPDDVPEPPETPVTQPGELIILGSHRLICGDSGDPEILARLMDGHKAALYATDPPYGVAYDGTNHPAVHGRTKQECNRDWSADYQDLDAWDHFKDQDEFEAFLHGVFANALPHVTADAAWYTWHASATSESFRRVWQQVGIRYHQTIVWVKPCMVLGYSAWHWKYEPCMMGWRQGNKPPMYPVPDEQSNIWEIDWEGRARCTDGAHPTQKPVRLFELPMLKHTRPGEICLETFAGSGSQLIAAERLGRRCFAAEIHPKFCDVAIARWEAFTGLTAERQAVR